MLDNSAKAVREDMSDHRDISDQEKPPLSSIKIEHNSLPQTQYGAKQSVVPNPTQITEHLFKANELVNISHVPDSIRCLKLPEAAIPADGTDPTGALPVLKAAARGASGWSRARVDVRSEWSCRETNATTGLKQEQVCKIKWQRRGNSNRVQLYYQWELGGGEQERAASQGELLCAFFLCSKTVFSLLLPPTSETA